MLWVSGDEKGQNMHLASLRKILEYDEELGPTLTVIGEVLSQLLVLLSFFKVLIEIKDATASKKWAKDQARLQKQQRVVFKGPVRSGLLPLRGLDRDRDRSSYIENPQKTGPNRQRPVYSGRSQSFGGYKTGPNRFWFQPVCNRSGPVLLSEINVF